MTRDVLDSSETNNSVLIYLSFLKFIVLVRCPGSLGRDTVNIIAWGSDIPGSRVEVVSISQFGVRARDEQVKGVACFVCGLANMFKALMMLMNLEA